jgi:hypothetical protein
MVEAEGNMKYLPSCYLLSPYTIPGGVVVHLRPIIHLPGEWFGTAGPPVHASNLGETGRRQSCAIHGPVETDDPPENQDAKDLPNVKPPGPKPRGVFNDHEVDEVVRVGQAGEGTFLYRTLS